MMHSFAGLDDIGENCKILHVFHSFVQMNWSILF